LAGSEPNVSNKLNLVLQDIIARIKQKISSKDEQDFLINLVRSFEVGGKDKVYEILRQKIEEAFSGVEEVEKKVQEEIERVLREVRKI